MRGEEELRKWGRAIGHCDMRLEKRRRKGWKGRIGSGDIGEATGRGINKDIF